MLRINLKNLKLNLNIKSLLKVVLIILLRGCTYKFILMYLPAEDLT